jgi:phospholipid/cholesterol/gamma-HCH transport system permease protein
VIFVVSAFASGFAFGAIIGETNPDPSLFTMSVFKAARPFDAIGLLVKCMLPALLTGVVCCTEGLSVEGGVTEIPGAVRKALARSLGALFVTSVVVSFLSYTS